MGAIIRILKNRHHWQSHGPVDFITWRRLGGTWIRWRIRPTEAIFSLTFFLKLGARTEWPPSLIGTRDFHMHTLGMINIWYDSPIISVFTTAVLGWCLRYLNDTIMASASPRIAHRDMGHASIDSYICAVLGYVHGIKMRYDMMLS